MQKMMALKKAYAEIILNTAKEAAARIMVSERRALHFQQELSSTKDEALRMLLRLKQMIDAKVSFAAGFLFSCFSVIVEIFILFYVDLGYEMIDLVWAGSSGSSLIYLHCRSAGAIMSFSLP